MGIARLRRAISERPSASQIGIRRMAVKGQMISIPNKLKSRWEKAVVTATMLPVANDANMAVTVVPTLAPSVYGKICVSVNRPAAARGTAREVVIELLCTKTVRMRPKRKARRGKTPQAGKPPE